MLVLPTDICIGAGQEAEGVEGWSARPLLTNISHKVLLFVRCKTKGCPGGVLKTVGVHQSLRARDVSLSLQFLECASICYGYFFLSAVCIALRCLTWSVSLSESLRKQNRRGVLLLPIGWWMGVAQRRQNHPSGPRVKADAQ